MSSCFGSVLWFPIHIRIVIIFLFLLCVFSFSFYLFLLLFFFFFFFFFFFAFVYLPCSITLQCMLIHWIMLTFYFVTLFISSQIQYYANILIKLKKKRSFWYGKTHYTYLLIVTRTEHPKWQVIFTQIVQYLLINSRITGNIRNQTGVK
jgi:hypothetical protein